MKDTLKKSLLLVEQGFEDVRDAFYNRRGYTSDILLIPYNGYGNHETMQFEGRVLKDKNISESSTDDSIFDNIERMYKHFNSAEQKDVNVTATLNQKENQVMTDDEGYYKFEIPFQGNKNQLWHSIDIKLTEDQHDITQQASVQVPSENALFGIISDIDDTIIQTGAASFMKMLKSTFTKNASTRVAFSGVAELYDGLQKGNTTEVINPLFYLSNSPWNLYEFLDEFMELKDIPKGSILLRDWGIDDTKMIVDNDHKIDSITKLLNTYPNLPFILIGDSGEKDPEYYHQIIQQFPNRILAVYIRDVTNEPRDSEVKEIAQKVEVLGVPMFLMEDSLLAAEHAFSNKWIDEQTLSSIKKSIK